MPWEPGPPGKLMKVIERDEHGDPIFFVVYLPPSDLATEHDIELPFRHVHTDVYENSLVLSGELPHSEYWGEDQEKADIYVKTPGVWMRRKPGSMHGLEPGFHSRTGATLLFWRSAGGTYFGEKNYDEVSPHIPFKTRKPGVADYNLVVPGENGVIFDRPDFKAIDTTLMDWEPGPPGKYVKVLDRDEDGIPWVFITYIPPGMEMDDMPDVPFRHYHKSIEEHSFVLASELPHWEYEDADQKVGTMYLKEPGTAMYRKPGPGTIHGIEKGAVSRTGCTILYWRTPGLGGGTWVGEDRYEEESIHVPF
jgi:hypothetical protein